MTIILDILKELSRDSLNYKGMRVNFLGLPKFRKYPSNSLRATMSNLVKDGLVGESDEGLCVTRRGRDYIRRKIDSLRQFDFMFEKNAPKNLMLMFDVPEAKKAEREWLRWHLKKFKYTMIQKSVWVGPSPLPQEFLDYLEKIKLKDSVKTFKLAKGYK